MAAWMLSNELPLLALALFLQLVQMLKDRVHLDLSRPVPGRSVGMHACFDEHAPTNAKQKA